MKKKKQKKVNILKRCYPYMGKKKVLLPASFFLSAVSAACTIVPFVLVWAIIRVILKDPANFEIESIKGYLIAIGVTGITGTISYFIALSLSHLAAFRLEAGLHQEGLKTVFSMPLGYFDQTESGRIRKVIYDSASTTHTFFAHNFPDLAAVVVVPLMMLIMVIAVDWKMGLTSLLPIVISMVIISRTYTVQGGEYVKQYYTSMAKMSSESVEYVRGIPVVKTFGQSVHSFKNFYNSIMEYKDYVEKYTLFSKRSFTLSTTFVHAVSFFIVPLAFLLIHQGQSLGLVMTDIIFYMIITTSFVPWLMRIMFVQHNKQIAETALDNIEKIIDYKQIEYKDSPVELKDYSVELKNISFAYEKDGKKAIDDISLKVKEGETVALVGPSGSGKTTLARLVARFWDTDEGNILIGGVDIKDIPKNQLMKNISFVFQNTSLFSTSIKDNIIMNKKDVKDEDIQKAIKLSQSQDIIDELPDGINTIMGTKGTYLSGGQKQRISLARAILKDAPIVLLDEATAFADPENEHLIQKALKELSKGKTTLMIAHRLSTVKNLDRIVVLDQGKIAEQGTHQELMKLNGLYKSMFDEYQESIEWKISSEVVGEVN